jgi:hypothetical protein
MEEVQERVKKSISPNKFDGDASVASAGKLLNKNYS